MDSPESEQDTTGPDTHVMPQSGRSALPNNLPLRKRRTAAEKAGRAIQEKSGDEEDGNRLRGEDSDGVDMPIAEDCEQDEEVERLASLQQRSPGTDEIEVRHA